MICTQQPDNLIRHLAHRQLDPAFIFLFYIQRQPLFYIPSVWPINTTVTGTARVGRRSNR